MAASQGWVWWGGGRESRLAGTLALWPLAVGEGLIEKDHIKCLLCTQLLAQRGCLWMLGFPFHCGALKKII